MKIVITQASCRQLVECRHFARTAKCAWLSEADVVEQNDHNIRRSLRRFHFKSRWRLGIARVKLRDSWRLRLWNRKHGPINLLRHQRQRQQARRSDQQMYHWRVLHYISDFTGVG